MKRTHRGLARLLSAGMSLALLTSLVPGATAASRNVEYEVDADASYRPVVLLEKKYAVYLEAGENALEALQPTEKERGLIVDNPKLLLIGKFMEDYGYEKTFENEKFVIYE